MTAPVYDRHGVTVLGGDCQDVLRELADASVDAIVTDPPYGIRFMGKAWDGADIEAGIVTRRGQAPMPDGGKAGATGGYQSAAAEAGRYDQSATANQAFQSWCQSWAAECLRVLKPGGHMLAFGSPRTAHRLAAGIEDAGFEIRDTIMWVYGSGFPKSLDVSKAIDATIVHGGANSRRIKATNASRPGEVRTRTGTTNNGIVGEARGEKVTNDNPATDQAAHWQGWGTALKPSQEPIIVARKPLAGTVAGNVLAHGTGALNIDGCRVGTEIRTNEAGGTSSLQRVSRVEQGYRDHVTTSVGEASIVTGRWPSNMVLTHHPDCADPGPCTPSCAVAELNQQSGALTSGKLAAHHARAPKAAGVLGAYSSAAGERGYGDTGGASRFFPVFRWEAKAPTSERPQVDGISHPTVKPIDLMRWCVRLVTPPAGLVLDPFAGSGTTLHAARAEGMRAIGVEREGDYLRLIAARLDARPRAAAAQPGTSLAVDDGEPVDLPDLLGDAS